MIGRQFFEEGRTGSAVVKCRGGNAEELYECCDGKRGSVIFYTCRNRGSGVCSGSGV